MVNKSVKDENNKNKTTSKRNVILWQPSEPLVLMTNLYLHATDCIDLHMQIYKYILYYLISHWICCCPYIYIFNFTHIYFYLHSDFRIYFQPLFILLYSGIQETYHPAAIHSTSHSVWSMYFCPSSNWVTSWLYGLIQNTITNC